MNERETQRDIPEFSRPVDVESLSYGRTTFEFEATSEERRNLAKRLAVSSIEALRADIQAVRRGSRDSLIVDVAGSARAEYEQICVVTLEPVSFDIEFEITARYAGENDESDDPEIEPFDDFSEPIENGVVDLGELIAQSLALEIDPFPRKPGADYEDHWHGDDADKSTRDSSDQDNPFSILKKLKEGS